MPFNQTPEKQLLNAVPDTPDVRDVYYQPALIPLQDSITPPKDLDILDQGTEGACTGFSLAATINFLNQAKRKPDRVSARMLYEMARKFDEWDGDDYSGSSCRGAMRGWQNMGVCDDELWPYKVNDDRELNIKQSKNARQNTPGAYYRLQHRVEDFHAALNEVGILYVSATVHEGWYEKNVKKGLIPHLNKSIGGHAFAIVGYDARGFFVQNSWGKTWGDNGIALWTYEDWRENISDGWVVRLAVPTPQLWGNSSFRGEALRGADENSATLLVKSPKRHEIKGHFVHVDDGEFHQNGKYFSSLPYVKETGDWLNTSDDYQHILFYAHGGLNNTDASAQRIVTMKNTFKSNGIYPYHFMYDTGLLEELKDIILKRAKNHNNKAAGMWDSVAERWDKLVENATRSAGRALWREMKRGATLPFNDNKAGSQTLSALLENLNPNIQVHVVGHSTGGILIAHLLKRLAQIRPTLRVSSCSLLAPACTVNDFTNYYQPLLEANANSFGINQMTIYNLIDELERNDTVTSAYRKSLLYLVSNAFEEKRGEAILGMERFCSDISTRNLEFVYSDEKNVETRTNSIVHGGFDNDPDTMNDILRRVIGAEENPTIHFTKKNLDY